MRAVFKRVLLLNAHAANEGPGILVFHQLHFLHSGANPEHRKEERSGNFYLRAPGNCNSDQNIGQRRQVVHFLF